MKLRSPRFYHDSPSYKRLLVRQAKSKPCVDCLAEGRRADWPWPAMTLDHTGRKTMEFTSIGGRNAQRLRGWVSPSFSSFSASEIKRELATCDPVCAGHQNMRTRARLLARDLDPDEDEGDDDEGELTLFQSLPSVIVSDIGVIRIIPGSHVHPLADAVYMR